MRSLNDWLHDLADNYVLLTAGAILFFAVKGLLGYLTFRHYDKRLSRLESELTGRKPRLRP